MTRLTMLFLVTLVSSKCLALTLCPTAVWLPNATTVVDAFRNESTTGSNAVAPMQPRDVDVVNDSMLYILDSENMRVQRVMLGSNELASVIGGDSAVSVSELMSMSDMSVDANGSVYILDSDDGKVVKWSPDNSTMVVVAGGKRWGADIDQLLRPLGMFVDHSTSIIWVADTGNHRIAKYSPSIESVIIYGSYGSNQSQFNVPSGLFVDTDDAHTIYVADTLNHRVQSWCAEATSGITVAGITNYYGNGLNQLWNPTVVVVDNNQNLFIIDSYNNRIVRWRIGESVGVIVVDNRYSADPSDEALRPIGIAFDSNGMLYVADASYNRVQKFVVSCAVVMNTSTTTSTAVCTVPHSVTSCAITTYASNATTIAGSELGWNGQTASYLSFPADAVVDENDVLYVSDSSNNRLQRLSRNSTMGTTILSRGDNSTLNDFGALRSLTVDANGSVYFLDNYKNRVIKWTPETGSRVTVADGRRADGDVRQLRYPGGLFIGSNASVIWIADTGNSRVVRWTWPTIAAVVCGGIGSQADQLRYPTGLFVDVTASETLYVADTYNHRIQKFLPEASAGTTVAGQTLACSGALSQLCYPSAVIKDPQGFLYIADTENNRVVRWWIGATAGAIVAGDLTTGVLPHQLYRPSSVKFDLDGALIVADTWNNRIQKFSVTCVPLTLSNPSTLPMESNTSKSTPMVATEQTSSSSTHDPAGLLASSALLCSIIILIRD